MMFALTFEYDEKKKKTLNPICVSITSCTTGFGLRTVLKNYF